MDKYEISAELAKKIMELKIGNVPDNIGIDGKIEILIDAYDILKFTLEKNEKPI